VDDKQEDSRALATRTLLCVERRSEETESRCAALRNAGYEIIWTDSVSQALKAFVSQTVDAVLLAAEFGNGKKQSVRAQMSSIRPHIPIVGILRDGEVRSVDTKSFTRIYRESDGSDVLVKLLHELFAGKELR